jgi:hypothetical protein
MILREPWPGRLGMPRNLIETTLQDIASRNLFEGRGRTGVGDGRGKGGRGGGLVPGGAGGGGGARGGRGRGTSLATQIVQVF